MWLFKSISYNLVDNDSLTCAFYIALLSIGYWLWYQDKKPKTSILNASDKMVVMPSKKNREDKIYRS